MKPTAMIPQIVALCRFARAGQRRAKVSALHRPAGLGARPAMSEQFTQPSFLVPDSKYGNNGGRWLAGAMKGRAYLASLRSRRQATGSRHSDE